MMQYSPGMAMRQNYGSGFCPHCQQPFQRTNKNQITCAKIPCQDKQNSEANRKRKAKLKAKRGARRGRRGRRDDVPRKPARRVDA